MASNVTVYRLDATAVPKTSVDIASARHERFYGGEGDGGEG